MTGTSTGTATKANSADSNFTTLADKLDQKGMATDTEPDRDDLDMDCVLSILSNERRRVTLDILADRGPTRKSELADLVAARLADDTDDPDAVDRGFRKTVYVTLHQDHLPRMVDHGVLAEQDDVYGLGPNAEQVLDVLARIERNEAVLDAVGNALSRFTDRLNR